MGWVRKLITGTDKKKITNLSKLDPEQFAELKRELVNESQNVGVKEYVKLMKQEKREKQLQKFEGVLKKIVPKGIKSSDSIVRNQHLYFGGKLSQQVPKTHKKTRLM